MTEAEPADAVDVSIVMPEEHSPIVTEENFPVAAVKPEMPKKEELAAFLISEETLLAEMKKAGGKDLTTHQFAILIAKPVKKSEDPILHHKWDQAHGEIRSMMRKLEKAGKVSSRKDPNSKKLRYLYSLV